MPDRSFHRLMPPSDSVRLKPLGMKLDRLGGDPAAVAEISPQSGKGEEANSLGRRKRVWAFSAWGLRLLLCQPASHLSPAERLKH